MTDIKREGKSFQDMKKADQDVIGGYETGSGKTESGQPRAYQKIHTPFHHPGNAGLNRYGHTKAGNIHATLAIEKRKQSKRPGKSLKEAIQLGREAEHHEKQRDLHRAAASKL